MLPSWSLYLPSAQSLQADCAVPPGWSAYFPAAQSVQTLEPPIQYVPAGQHAEEAIEPCSTPSNIPPLVAVLSTQEGPQRGSWLYEDAKRNTVHQCTRVGE